jgi:hypothetical protein
MRTPSSSKHRLDLAPLLADQFISGFPIDYGPVLLLMPFGFPSRWTPCPPKYCQQWLQLRLGCIQLSPSCPFRRLHTFCLLRPTRNYPRFWIWRPSFERQRDFNPPGLLAAQHTLRVLRLGLLQDGNVGIGVFPEGEKVLVATVRTWDCVTAATILSRAGARCRILRGYA